METRLKEMQQIMDEKKQDDETRGIQPLNPEGVAMAEHKRFTFDVIDTPVDPLR